MAYALRKINHSLTHRGFKWDITIGAVNTAPDWKPTDECGNGLHFCAPGDDFGYLEGDILVVVEYDETKAIDLDGKHKAESCTVVWVSENGSTDGLEKFINPLSFRDITSEAAYRWARDIGDRERMRQFVTDSQWAYYWARNIGDREHMKKFVTDSQWAYWWAHDIGDREHMKKFVTDSQWAYYWAMDIGDKEHMKQFVTESEWAYCWAKNIGDWEHMKQFVTDSQYAYHWTLNNGDKEHMRQSTSKWQRLCQWVRNIW